MSIWRWPGSSSRWNSRHARCANRRQVDCESSVRSRVAERWLAVSILRRRPKLPAALKPALEPEERVLSWAPVGDDRALVATNLGLWLPDGERLGWHEIHKAAWSGRELRITPAEVAEERGEYLVL